MPAHPPGQVAARAAEVARAYGPAFEVYAPAELASPLVIASPHSGRLYPADFLQLSRLDATSIRGSEDAWVDTLFATAPEHGAPLIAARYARAFVDLNRAPLDLDPTMFFDAPADLAGGRSDRARLGLGSIPRIVAHGAEIYARRLDFAEALARLEAVHRPYHAELDRRLAAAHARFGVAILIDAHSMPAAARPTAGPGPRPDVILGDRFATACAPALTEAVERALGHGDAAGYVIARNRPYAGGYTTTRHGRPSEGRHALQIELARDLYLDEARLTTTAGFVRLQTAIDRLIAELAARDWRALGAR